MDGKAVLIDAIPRDDVQKIRVIDRFITDRGALYSEFIACSEDFESEIAREVAKQCFTYVELEEEDGNLHKASGLAGKVRKLDFCGAASSTAAGETLKACEALLDNDARQVFEANQDARGE